MQTAHQPEYIEEFRRRGLALLYDGSARTQHGVLVSAAVEMTAGRMNEILHMTGGLTLVALSPKRAASFLLPPMARPRMTTAAPEAHSRFCISVDAREGITTGISAADRAETIRVLGEEAPQPRKLVKPGHIFPMETSPGGVLVKNALPEGALDLVVISGYTDAALFVDLLNENGESMTVEEQLRLAEQQRLPRIELSELVRYRLETEKLVYKVAEAKLPTQQSGELRSFIYKSRLHEGEHLALVRGEINPDEAVLTRVQTESTLLDVFGGDNPSTRPAIQASLQAIKERGSGVLLYLRRSTPGHLKKQIREAAEPPSDPGPAAIMREYGVGAQILYDLGVRKIELLTNSRKNLVGLRSFGIEVVSQRPLAKHCGELQKED